MNSIQTMVKLGPFKGSISRHGDKQKLVVIPADLHDIAGKYHDKKFNVTIILEPLDNV